MDYINPLCEWLERRGKKGLISGWKALSIDVVSTYEMADLNPLRSPLRTELIRDGEGSYCPERCPAPVHSLCYQGRSSHWSIILNQWIHSQRWFKIFLFEMQMELPEARLSSSIPTCSRSFPNDRDLYTGLRAPTYPRRWLWINWFICNWISNYGCCLTRDRDFFTHLCCVLCY